MQDIKAQDYLDQQYPFLIQRIIKKINISEQKLTGYLDLRNFPKLEELDCSKNSIAELDLSNCKSLKKLEADNNLRVIWKRNGKNLLVQNYRRKKEELKEKDPESETKKNKRNGQIISNLVVRNKLL